MDLNHRPHAYQACALNQLSYRPLHPDVSDAFHAKRFKEPRRLGPWKLNSKQYLGNEVFASLESPPVNREVQGLTLGLVA